MDYKQIIDLAIRATNATAKINTLYALKGGNPHLHDTAFAAIDEKIDELNRDLNFCDKKIKSLTK